MIKTNPMPGTSEGRPRLDDLLLSTISDFYAKNGVDGHPSRADIVSTKEILTAIGLVVGKLLAMGPEDQIHGFAEVLKASTLLGAEAHREGVKP
jgi:hypothetical protein